MSERHTQLNFKQCDMNVDEFYAKYGTGINYADNFAIMCRMKSAQSPVVGQFIADLKEVCENDYDEMLARDYQVITNY